MRRKGEKERLISPRHAADRPPVVPVVVVGRVNVTTSKVQVVSVVATVDRTRPVVRFATSIVKGAVIDVAGPHKP